MAKMPKPPKAHSDFVKRYPLLADAWDKLAEAGMQGPLDERTQRLVKFAISIGAMREGSIHSNVRKGLALGIERQALEQVIALAAGTLGLPSTVAVYGWTQDEIAKQAAKTAKKPKSKKGK